MTNYLPTKKGISILMFLLFTVLSYGQLDDFTLIVTPTPQTCLGNGTLTFTVVDNDPEASIDYSVYLLPDTTTPLTTVTTNTVTGLSAGEYLVIATQSLGALSNTSSANATIVNQVQPLTYTLTPTKVKCGDDGVITVNVLTGSAVSYEILSGPITVPQQASNVFNNLPLGLYTIRVYDDCGEAVVVTVQIIQDNTDINISNVLFTADGILPSCNTITLGNAYDVAVNGYNIFWPLNFEYTVYPPGGGTPSVITETVASGSLEGPNPVYTTIPFYNDQEYYYDLVITDACGNIFTRENNIVNQRTEFYNNMNYDGCEGNALTIEPINYVGPIVINFDSSPDGFDPSAYNSNHPNFSGEAVYSSSNPLPLGAYTLTVTDACGSSYTGEFELFEPELQPLIAILGVCGTGVGTVDIEVPAREITSIIITSAPATYGEPLPDDVIEFVDGDGVFNMPNLPLGDYVFVIEDSCGDEYTSEIEVEITDGEFDITVLQRPGCEIGSGSIRILDIGADFETVFITDGPAEYSATYPVDVSANISISNGDLYINSLPEGDYEFTITNECDFIHVEPVDVEGYTIQTNEVEVIPYCGSFQLDIEHLSNGNYIKSFWLQRYDEVTETWGDPLTGEAYTSGLPDNDNSDFINLNLPLDEQPFYSYVGDFRIVKAFYTYSNGTSANNFCFSVINEFTFTGAPVITNVYSFPCAGGLTEVAVEVEGIDPFTYKITSKDGEPFVIDNGNSNIFSGIEPAYYNFQVIDDCENIINAQFNIGAVDPITISAFGFCEEEDSSLSVQPLSFLNYEWYAASDPTTILSITNSLEFPVFNSEIDSDTYYVSITTDNDSSCMNQVLEYIVAPNVLPNAGDDNDSVLCNEGLTVSLSTYLTTPHDDGGVWEDVDASGALVDGVLNTDGLSAGTYNFKYVVTGLCDSSDEALVTLTFNDTPDAPTIHDVEAICEGENIELSVTPVEGASYFWVGPNGFESIEVNPIIVGASPNATGVYGVTATINGCTSPLGTVGVVVNASPDFNIQGNTALCEGQSTVLTVAPENFNVNDVDFEWYYEDELLLDVTSASVELFETGVYQVIVDNNGCETPLEANVTPNTTGFDVELEAGCENFEYVLSIVNIDELQGYNFEWSGPSGYSYTGEEAVITNLEGGEYAVTVTNLDGCSVVAVIMVENTACIIPRGISPNGDEYNQYFDLSNLGVQDLQIFNRYGLQVYEKQNYVNEWYGQSDKGDLPAGTYFYVATLSAGKKVTGWVYLQRPAK